MDYRSYQHEAVDEIWAEMFTDRHILLVASTGLGKTEIIILLLKKCLEKLPSFRCVFLVNKISLLDQSIRRLRKALGDVVGEFSSETKDLSMSITVATIQSIKSVEFFGNMIVVDETHAINIQGGTYKDFIERCEYLNPKIKTVGCTATPYRSGQGYIYGEGKFYKRACFVRDLNWSLDNGYLVKPITKKVPEQYDTSGLRITAGDFNQKDIEALTGNEQKVIAQIKDAIPRMTDRKKIVWACASIAHCEMVTRLLIDIGEEAQSVHSKKDNSYSMDSFTDGDTRHLVFVTIISEGFDYPPIDCVVLMRPIASANLYVQTVGRGLRLCGDKENCLVLDYGRVVETCGKLDKPFIKTGGKKLAKKQKDYEMIFCKVCLEYCDSTQENCPVCNSPLKEKKDIVPAKLTHKVSGGSLLSFSQPATVRQVMIKEVIIDDQYISKAGKKCYEIEFVPYGWIGNRLRNYYTKEYPRYYQDRMKEIESNKGALIVECKVNNGYWQPGAVGAGDPEKYPTLLKFK